MTSSDAELMSALRAAFGPGARLREGQAEAVLALAKPGARVLLVQSTGWGKSVVYFLAARKLGDEGRGMTLVISPLIALMRNQAAFARRFGLRAEAMHSENREDWPAIEEALLAGQIDLLLVSPERLHSPEFGGQMLPAILPKTALVVIDEAHCISEWGHDFRPEYRTVLRQLAALPKEAAVLCATATATDRVVQDLRRLMGPFLDVQRGRLVRPSLRLVSVPLESRAERLAWLAKYLPKFPGSGIVYVLTVFDAKEVARWLQKHGIAAEAYHAELDGARRVELEQAFTENRVKALVATTALGMGYDKGDVGFVVHYQLPASLIAYYQQIGRAGRAVDKAYAVLLGGGESKEIVESFVNSARAPKRVFEELVRALELGPKSFGELQHDVAIAPSVLRHCLDILDAADALVWRDGMYQVRPLPARREIEQGESVRALRREEFQQLLAYIELSTCRMQAVAAALGDPLAEPCGVCDRCKPIPEPHLDPATIAEAREFLEGEPKVLVPRFQLPGRRLRPDERNLPGIVLGSYGDEGYGQQVREGKYGSGRFADTLVEAAARAIETLEVRPEWIAWIPSSRAEPPLEEFCRRLAVRLRVPAIRALKRVRPGPPQKSMTSAEEQFQNVANSFAVVEARPGTCLLVDDIVDSGWTLTVAGLNLREAGSGPVIPLALAATSTRRIRLPEEQAV